MTTEQIDKTSWDLDQVKRAYGSYAGIYNWVCGWCFTEGRQIAAHLLNLTPGSRVLEVGVGTGASLEYYPPHARITGIDISEQMLKEARKVVERKRLAHVERLQLMDAQAMEFEDNTFDAVVAMHIATVVPDPLRFVNEMRRVGKPGGSILIVSYFDQRETLAGRVSALLAPILGRLLGFRPKLSFEEFVRTTCLSVENRHYVNLFNLWSVIEVRNEKETSWAAQSLGRRLTCEQSVESTCEQSVESN